MNAPPVRHRTARRLAVVVVAGLVLAGCGADEPASEPASAPASAPGGDTSTASATTAEPSGGDVSPAAEDTGASAAAVVTVADSDRGQVLVDGDGNTLYVFDNDDVDTSACTEGCLDAWPPVLADAVEAGDGVTADLGTFTREDGRIQVTANGLPLYRFASDAGPGDTQGQGVGGVWWVADAAGAAVTEAAGDESTEATYGDSSY